MATAITIKIHADGVFVYTESATIDAELMELLSDIQGSLNRIYGERSPFAVKVENVEKFEGEAARGE